MEGDVQRDLASESTDAVVTREVPVEAIEELARGSGPVMRMLQDRYELGHRLGRGGMADVYAARDRVLDRDVVVKLLRSEWQGNENQRDRFIREAKLLAELDSDRLAQVLDVCMSDEHCFIVMRRLHGRNVEQIVNSTGPFDPSVALQIMHDVLGGLSALHALGLVHRDVKPANVLVGNDDRATLLDLGVAHDRRRPRITPATYTVGTLNFMSPELRRSSDVDHRSDLYQAGLLLLYMTTGMTPRELDAPTLESALHDGLPRSVAPIISRALLPVEKRYATVEQMSRDVHAAMYAGTTIELGTRDVLISSEELSTEQPILLVAPPRSRPAQPPRSWHLTFVMVALVAVCSLEAYLLRDELGAASVPASPVLVDSPGEEVVSTSTRAWLPISTAQATSAVPAPPTRSVERHARSAAPRPAKTRAAGASLELPIPDDMSSGSRAWLERAARHAQNGAREGAIAAYRAFLRAAPEDPYAPRVRAHLWQLESSDTADAPR